MVYLCVYYFFSFLGSGWFLLIFEYLLCLVVKEMEAEESIKSLVCVLCCVGS